MRKLRLSPSKWQAQRHGWVWGKNWPPGSWHTLESSPKQGPPLPGPTVIVDAQSAWPDRKPLHPSSLVNGLWHMTHSRTWSILLKGIKRFLYHNFPEIAKFPYKPQAWAQTKLWGPTVCLGLPLHCSPEVFTCHHLPRVPPLPFPVSPLNASLSLHRGTES